MKYCRRYLLLGSFLFSLLFREEAAAQFAQQEDKLVGTGAVGSAEQACSVSLSSDGNTVIVGGCGDSNGVGAAWVFTRSGGMWSQEGTKLVGSGAVGSALQGGSVSLSSDGNTAIVGGYRDNNFAGAAWVFTRSNGVWSQQGDKLVGTGAVGSANQGCSVSLSGDGNTAIVGGYYDNYLWYLMGAAWVFTRSNGVWSQQGVKLVGTGGVGNAYQGCSVSLSSDGNTAVVGGHYDNYLVGAAWVFTRSGDVWTQQGNKLVGTGAVRFSWQGYSVSLSSDGNTAIVGGPADNEYAGAAWVFTRSAGVWTQQGNKLVGTSAVPVGWQGCSVSLSSDGNTAIVGADDNTSEGAWVFSRSGSVWGQEGTRLVGTGAVGSANQGCSVSLSGDGNTAVLGGPLDNGLVGATWVFVRSATGAGEHASEIPQQFDLAQSYPNPFNPSTTIKYELPRASQVNLRVFDILGREVSVLVNERRDAGVHEVKFDGSNLASGIYFYRLTAGDFVQSKKLLLLK